LLNLKVPPCIFGQNFNVLAVLIVYKRAGNASDYERL